MNRNVKSNAPGYPSLLELVRRSRRAAVAGSAAAAILSTGCGGGGDGGGPIDDVHWMDLSGVIADWGGADRPVTKARDVQRETNIPGDHSTQRDTPPTERDSGKDVKGHGH